MEKMLIVCGGFTQFAGIIYLRIAIKTTYL